MRGFLSLLLTMFIGLPSFALAQNESLGFNVIDYQAFQELPREDQREYLLLIMDTVVEMEEALIDRSTPKEERRVEILKKLLNQLMIDSAYAAPSAGNTKSCLYAGWFSTYERVAGKNVCRRPNLSSNETIRTNYNKLKSKCAPAQQTCNPDIFGTNAAGTPYCINIDKVRDINASLSCLMAFEDDPDKTSRLDRIIDRLSKDASAAESFNKVVQTIFNTCVCQDNAKENGHNVQIAQEYFDYMKGHRTCYSLVAQTQHIAERLKTNKPNACLVINPNNVDILAKDLKVLSHYSLRVRDVAKINGISNETMMMRGFNTSPSNKVRVMSNGNLVWKDAATAIKYDKDNDIDNCLAKMRDPSSSLTCALPEGRSLSDKKHCPFELPPVTTYTCKIKITPGVVAQGKMAFEANLEIAPNGTAIDDLDVNWKLGSETKTSKGGKFSGSVAVTGSKGKIPLSAKLTIAGKEIPCNEPLEDFQGIVDDKIKSCEIGEVRSEIKEGKLHITATAKALPPGAKAPAPTWKVGTESQSSLVFTAPANDVSEVELTALFAVEEVGKPAIECKKLVPITRPEGRSCIVADAKLEAIEGKPKTHKISGTIKFAETSMQIKDGESFKYQIAPNLTNYEGASVSREQDFDSATPEVEIIGMLVKGQQTLLTCKAIAKKTTPPAPQAPGSCTITPILALNDKGEDIIEVSLTAPDANGEPKGNVTFTGFAFKNSKPKVANVVIKKLPTVQKKKIKAAYKNEAGRDFKCEVGVEIPAAEAQAAPAGAMPPQQQLPPSIPAPDIFLQGVN